MGKPKGINQKGKYTALYKRLPKHLTFVQGIYSDLSKTVANIVMMAGYDGTQPFAFSDYPQLKPIVDRMFEGFRNSLETSIITSTKIEWDRSNAVQDMLADKCLKYYTHEINREKYKKYYLTNNDAYRAFITRKDHGMNLSKRVWNESKDLKKELESVISVAIEKGTSAVTLSKKISKYLRDFDKIQPDYKEKYGTAKDISNCEYRSMRLARSEINMSYRTAEQERWKQFDFVLGKEIKTSGNHPKDDMCDILQGVYPKDFDWVGWHPQCRCYEVPILMNEAQFMGLEPAEPITDVPDNFKEWIVENEDRIEQARERGTEPHFVDDNMKYVRGYLE